MKIPAHGLRPPAFKTTLIASVGAFLIGATSVVNSDCAFESRNSRTVGIEFPSSRIYRAPRDPEAPAGYSQLGIAKIDGARFGVYAFQNGARPEDVTGQGQGFADVFDSAGHLTRRFFFRENLNSPPQITEYVSMPAR